MIQHLIGLSHWQICLVTVYLFVQGAFFTVFPEEVVLPTLGVLWSQGRVGFFEAAVSAMIGLVLGDLILLALGRGLGMRLLVRKPFSWIIDPEVLGQTLDRLHKHGPWLIFMVRFTPMVRAPIFFASGIARIRIWRFLRSDLAGLAIWVPLLILAGRRIGASGSIDQAFHKLGLLMVVLIGSGILISTYREQKKRIRHRRNQGKLRQAKQE